MTPEFMAQLDEIESLAARIAERPEGGFHYVTRAEASAVRDALEAAREMLGGSGTVVPIERARR